MGHKIVAYGEALWDMLPAGPVLGGAPFNFAYRVNTLGNQGIIITRLGKDEKGTEAFARIEELNMETEFVQWDEDKPTGTVEITLGENNEPDYYIVPDVAYDYIRMENGLTELVKGADCLCFGTLIQRTAVSGRTLDELIGYFKGKYILLDINLRKNCYSLEIIKKSIKRANILKLNETEIGDIAGMYNIDHESVSKSAEELLKKTGISLIVVTLGEKGAYAFPKEGKREYSPGYSIDLADPCGSGDAFTAAFLTSLLKGDDLPIALQRGNALGALVAAQKGATQPIAEKQISDFIESSPPRVSAGDIL